MYLRMDFPDIQVVGKSALNFSKQVILPYSC
jgi:hypothetical protein